MPFYVSPDFHDDPRVTAAGAAAVGAWVQMGAWAAGYKLQGRIPKFAPKSFGLERHALRLVQVGLWREEDDAYIYAGLCRFTAPSPWRARIPDELRQQVYERDGYACVECGTAERLSLDHVTPWSLGGDDTYDNFQTLCTPCNSRKGARV
jgi:hypothetical protein